MSAHPIWAAWRSRTCGLPDARVWMAGAKGRRVRGCARMGTGGRRRFPGWSAAGIRQRARDTGSARLAAGRCRPRDAHRGGRRRRTRRRGHRPRRAWDRVLGGRPCPRRGAADSREPGVGKSTLLLEAAGPESRRPARSVYITARNRRPQVRRVPNSRSAPRHEKNLYRAAETDLEAIITHAVGVQRGCDHRLGADDSGGDVDGVPGGVTQVREGAATLTDSGQGKAMSTILSGMSQGRLVEGPRTLAHLVGSFFFFFFFLFFR